MGKRIGESNVDDRFTLLNFCRSCLQWMTSRNTAVYRHHGIFETVCYPRAFPNAVIPSLDIKEERKSI